VEKCTENIYLVTHTNKSVGYAFCLHTATLECLHPSLGLTSKSIDFSCDSCQQCLTRGIQELETLTHCFFYHTPHLPNAGPDPHLGLAHEPQVQHFKAWQKCLRSDEPA